MDVIPPHTIGSSGSLAVDASGNLYWAFSPREIAPAGM
jgi:hypothetical protein